MQQRVPVLNVVVMLPNEGILVSPCSLVFGCLRSLSRPEDVAADSALAHAAIPLCR